MGASQEKGKFWEWGIDVFPEHMHLFGSFCANVCVCVCVCVAGDTL